jgi:hypothetical protein
MQKENLLPPELAITTSPDNPIEDETDDGQEPEQGPPDALAPAVQKEESQTPQKENSPKGGAVPDEEEIRRREVDSRVSKATAAADESLRQVLGLLADSPEKLERLRLESPDIYARLEQRVPEKLSKTAPTQSQAGPTMAGMLETLLREREQQDVIAWAAKKGIGEADLKARQAELEATARLLQKETSGIKDWQQAVEFAGSIVFPSTRTSPAVPPAIPGGSSSSAPVRVPARPDEESEIDQAAMRATGASQDEVRKFTEGDILPAPF